MNAQRRWPQPWVFSLLILPLGMVIGFNFTALPYLLAKADVAVDRIATVASFVNLPGVLGFFIAPLVDVRLRRRSWLALGIAGTSIGACLYFPLVGSSHLNLLSAQIFAWGMVTFFVPAACGGLMIRMLSEGDQSKAAAWSQAGVLGGGALSGALVLWLTQRMPLFAAGICFAILIALLLPLPFTISEPPPVASPWFRGRLRLIGRELWGLLASPKRRWGTLLLLAPCATGAAQTLLPAIASHYSVGSSGVLWINGLAGGAALALGALSGALIPGDWDRRLTYVAAGALNALAAMFLLIANRPSIYLIGTALYLATEGLCWARSVALIVEIIGFEVRDTSTLYSLLNTAVTIPLLAMIWFDGVGFRRFGVHGLLLADATLNLLIFAVVAVVFVAYGIGLRTHGLPVSAERVLPGS